MAPARNVSSSPTAEDMFNIAGEWGPSNFDVKHKFVFSASYELPWDVMISGIIYIRSGFPYSAMHDGDLNGEWVLDVSDHAYWDTGTLETWTLRLNCR